VLISYSASDAKSRRNRERGANCRLSHGDGAVLEGSENLADRESACQEG
jgi:hypothetical protein